MTERPEPSSLRALVGHREFVHGDDSLEKVHQRFAAGRQDFMAVLDGHGLLGLCARRDIGTLLGARYGFALYARAGVREHLTSDAIRVSVDDRLTELLPAIAGRRDEHFYDDVLLVDAAGDFLGLIHVRDLVRLQTTMLLGNIAELEARQAEIAAKNRQMEDDLRMAREVQVAMLPREFPACRAGSGLALHFSHLYEPAGGVGGDFFDVLPVSDTAAGVIICDVMGHGVRSALITAMVRTMIEELRPHAGDPAGLLTRLNAHLTKLLQRTGDMIFVTAAYAVIDAANRRLSYAQAGHPTPLHRSARQGRVAPLPDAQRIGGSALGLLEDSVYEAAELTLDPGDLVLFFTDGIFEADNPQGEEFGVKRLAETWRAQAGVNPDAALTGLRAAVSGFAGGKPFADDVCLVACELRG
jgi:serine phosphatase RsbU (regulator of sigma subunit)